VFNKSLHPVGEEEVSGELMTNDPLTPEIFPEERRAALTVALRERFDMAAEDAQEIADTIAEVFAGELEVNDETIDPSIRSIFYTLEAKKILTFRRFEYNLETGEHRRGFAWRIREEALAPAGIEIPIKTEEDVYADLPRDVWTRPHA
jgi:hypothetical protein